VHVLLIKQGYVFLLLVSDYAKTFKANGEKALETPEEKK
jgi:hypothetical protein